MLKAFMLKFFVDSLCELIRVISLGFQWLGYFTLLVMMGYYLMLQSERVF